MLSRFLICSFKTLQPSLRNIAFSTTKFSRYGRKKFQERFDKFKYEKKPVHGYFSQPHPIMKDFVPIRPPSHLYKAVLFTSFITVGSFTIAAIIKYERTKEQLRSVIEDMESFFNKFFRNRYILDDRPQIQLSLPQQVALGIIGINVMITLLWAIPSLSPFMTTYFTNSFTQKKMCLTMLTSIFSHQSILHLFANMYVLWSFAPITMHKLTGVEQFCALYASSGVISSLISLTHKSIIKSPVRSIGASGAILGVLAYTCMKIPDARLQILFLPFFDFSAQSAVYGIILIDVIGLLGPWKMFDHAAHLGGSLFGIWYAMYGEHLVRNWYNLEVINVYKKLKEDN